MVMNLLHPDVQTTEIDLSQIISSVSTTVGAAVGASNRGPYEDIDGNKLRVPAYDTRQFVNLFGKPNPQVSFLHYSVLAALESMQMLYVSRVCGSGYAYSALISNKSAASNATATVAGGAASPLSSFSFDSYTDSVLLFTAENPGTWGNNVQIRILNSNDTTSTFDVYVYEVVSGTSILREKYVGCSRVKTNTDSSPNLDGFGRQRYVMDRINEHSQYIKVIDNLNATNTLVPKDTTSTVPVNLVNGANGSAVTEGDVVAIWNALYADPEVVNVNVLLNCGYVTASTFAVQSAMLSIAESRRDCIAVLDMPMSETDMAISSAATTWRQNVQNFNTSYAALYSPWIEVYDLYNDVQNQPVPPSGFVGQVYARTDITKDPWYAPAGLYGGGVGVIESGVLAVQGLTAYYSAAEQDLLYSAGVNYFRKFNGQGIVLWGQKTEAAVASAVDRVNVRRMLLVIEKAMAKYLQGQIFNLNNIFTRSQIVNALNLYLDNIKSRNGLYDYLVVCDTSNNTAQIIDNNELVVDVYVKPQKAAEFINLNLIITSSSANLTVLSASGQPIE
jgi:phage tail sheath protein FI